MKIIPLINEFTKDFNKTFQENLNPLNLEERYMIGGIKTESGIDRVIPIHEKIVPLVEEWLISGKLKINYGKYYGGFKRTIKALEIDSTHTPHDCRHTTATILDRLNANDLCVKLILGHKVKDITKGTYTHKTNQELVDTINLIKN